MINGIPVPSYSDTTGLRHELLTTLSQSFSSDSTGLRYDKLFYVPPHHQNREEYSALLHASTFVLCPTGYRPTSYRLYEVLEAGAIPVIVHDDDVPHALPFAKLSEWKTFVIIVPRSQLSTLPEKLLTLYSNEEVVEAMKRKGAAFFKLHLTYEATIAKVLGWYENERRLKSLGRPELMASSSAFDRKRMHPRCLALVKTQVWTSTKHSSGEEGDDVITEQMVAFIGEEAMDTRTSALRLCALTRAVDYEDCSNRVTKAIDIARKNYIMHFDECYSSPISSSSPKESSPCNIIKEENGKTTRTPYQHCGYHGPSPEVAFGGGENGGTKHSDESNFCVLEYERSAQKDAGFVKALETGIAPLMNIVYIDIADSFQFLPIAELTEFVTAFLNGEVAARSSNAAAADTNTASADSVLHPCDVLLVKSDWGWIVDRFARRFINKSTATFKVMLSIAGYMAPPWTDPERDVYGLTDDGASRSNRAHRELLTKNFGVNSINFYDIILYEAPLSKHLTQAHRCSVHAFGIDTDIMKEEGIDTDIMKEEGIDTVIMKEEESLAEESPRDIDVLFVGKFANYKRPWEMLNYEGSNRVAIGDYEPESDYPEGRGIVDELSQAGVSIFPMNFNYKELADVYRRAKMLFIPSTFLGGGERAVMEAKACGVPQIIVSPFNPKLLTMLNGPIYSHVYYGEQIRQSAMCALYQHLALEYCNVCHDGDGINERDLTGIGKQEGPEKKATHRMSQPERNIKRLCDEESFGLCDSSGENDIDEIKFFFVGKCEGGYDEFLALSRDYASLLEKWRQFR
jgi:glycosyltransferase involved in cell wall biosynthesis